MLSFHRMLLKYRYLARSFVNHQLEYLHALRAQRVGYQSRPQVKPEELPERILQEACPVFVLSTGRCGTKLLTNLLSLDLRLQVEHVPVPELLLPSRMAYTEGDDQPEAYRLATLCARYEHVRNAWLQGATYVETNNRITFFAPWLADIFPQSKFIHLVRHPGDFVRSAMRRKYYQGTLTDEGRIRPRPDDSAFQQWSQMDSLACCAWLWNATQEYCENFKRNIEPSRVMTVRAEDLFADADVTSAIFSFVGRGSPKKNKVDKLLASPTNAQQEGSCPVLDEWPEQDRETLRKQTPLADRYQYKL